MLGESAWEGGRELQPREVVTICDHLRFLSIGQKKGEIGWKSSELRFTAWFRALVETP